MAKRLESETFAAVLNRTVDPERLKKIGRANGKGCGSYADCDEFIICHADYYDKNEFIELFRLTDAIREHWDRCGIDFSVFLYLREGKIAGGHIYKYKEMSRSCPSRPAGYETEPTRQEIRITRRILNYLTSGS